jgi:sigma-B regulation protein RsbU (phosphoserine phosphatase)
VNDIAPNAQGAAALLKARSLTDLVPLATLQSIQERFAALGRMSVCICTTEGALITEPTWGSGYSAMIGNSPKGRREWLDAVRACVADSSGSRPKCNEGMEIYAAPIAGESTPLAVIILGIRKHLRPNAEKLARVASRYDLAMEEVSAAAEYLDPRRGGTPEAIQQFAEMLAHMIATLYGQSHRIKDQLDDLQAVHDISELLRGSLGLQQILDRTVHRVVEVMGVKACAIRLLDIETGELKIRAVCNLSAEYLNKGAILLEKSPIDAAAFAGESVYIENTPEDPRTRFPANARKEGIVSGLCVPLTYRGQTIGVIRVYTGILQRFSEGEVSLLRSIGSQAAAAIIHSRLYDEFAKSERVNRQLETAAQIQRRMLPACPPPHNGFEFGCVYDPTLQVGGDFYDFIELPAGEMGMCVADVVGKGIPAALLMASIRSALRVYAPTSDDITRVMRQVNRHLCRDTLTHEFATMCYCVLSAEERTLTYCNAGHPPPLLLRGDQFRELDVGGLAIGISSAETYQSGTTTLESGDMIVLITDGVTDALNFQGTSYGQERLRESIRRQRGLGAMQLAQQLLWDVRRFAGLTEQTDDITIVTLKVT